MLWFYYVIDSSQQDTSNSEVATSDHSTTQQQNSSSSHLETLAEVALEQGRLSSADNGDHTPQVECVEQEQVQEHPGQKDMDTSVADTALVSVCCEGDESSSQAPVSDEVKRQDFIKRQLQHAKTRAEEAAKRARAWQEIAEREVFARERGDAECRTPSPGRYGDEDSFLTKYEYRVEMHVYRRRRVESNRRKDQARREEQSKNVVYKRKRKLMRQISSTTEHILPEAQASQVYTSSDSDDDFIASRVLSEPDLFF